MIAELLDKILMQEYKHYEIVQNHIKESPKTGLVSRKMLFFDGGIYRLKGSLRFPNCIKMNRKENSIDPRMLSILYKHSKFENFIVSNTASCKMELNPIAYDSERPIAIPIKKISISDDALE